MSRSHRRRIPALLAVTATLSLLLAACASPPQSPPPVVVEGQYVLESPAYTVSYTSDEICAPAGSDVLVEADSPDLSWTYVSIVNSPPPLNGNETLLLVQTPASVVVPAPAECFKVSISTPSGVQFPAGTTIDYRIVAPGSAAPEVSPLSGSLTPAAGQPGAAAMSPRICAPIGTPVTVDFTGNEGTLSVNLYYSGTGSTYPPGTTDGSGSVGFVTTETCFSVSLLVVSLPPTTPTLDYTVTW